ncbi:dynein axonemal light chain 1 isoform X2 [Syngnathoides biaculeatus]|uniref:dynein axonemal light chain 1 isoform X2 n=1 Tax=Syngnathoides biaculeatus TaxID=300417 RepID=UPI002ADE1E02|nr:dynein axonemal light chain 1 isoform X2 [Syngnathoides biaculeatus]
MENDIKCRPKNHRLCSAYLTKGTGRAGGQDAKGPKGSCPLWSEFEWHGKATTVKEALAKWEEKTGEKSSEATVVRLYGQIPPIEKLDSTLSKIPNCEKLCLSTNCIDKITNLGELKHLKILSLGRNNIKAFTGLEAVGDTLEELWISYNLIEKMKGVHLMKKLRVLYMSNNLVKDWGEFSKLADIPCLEELVFVGNPLEEKNESGWAIEVSKRLPKLRKLDGHNMTEKLVDEDDG